MEGGRERTEASDKKRNFTSTLIANQVKIWSLHSVYRCLSNLCTTKICTFHTTDTDTAPFHTEQNETSWYILALKTILYANLARKRIGHSHVCYREHSLE
jgi:hypothetical protein